MLKHVHLQVCAEMTKVFCCAGGGAGHMAAVKALACLVHCPVRPSGLQPPPFPLSQVLPESNHSKSTEPAAALQRLGKVL